ncbi:MAG: hypothetical protein R3C25_14290 [Hyphomonadaceae bacterium]
MHRLAAAALAGALLAPVVARAEPGMAGEVYSPTVTRGESELELRYGALQGGDAGGEWQAKAEISHAVTGWWRPGLVGEWEREAGQTDFTAFALENVFDFTATRDWPVHFGGYLEYEWPQSGPDHVEAKLLMEHERGPLALTLNLIGEREVGGGAGNEWEFGYAAQAAYALNEDIALGLQGFGDAGTDDDFGAFGDHAHYWGPFAQFEVAHLGEGEIELQVGYLAGFGDAESDGQLRLKLEYEFEPR